MAQSEADKAWERRLRKLGLALLELEKHAVNGQGSAVELTAVNFKLDADNRTSVLVILKGDHEDGPLVAFVGAADMTSAVIATAKRIRGDGLRWRVDRPWGT